MEAARDSTPINYLYFSKRKYNHAKIDNRDKMAAYQIEFVEQ